MSFQFSLNALRFEDVRQEIIRYLTEKNADVQAGDTSLSGQFDYRGSNISYVIDTMAYTTMLMSYMLANLANDNFLDTTTLRKNAVSIAKTLGYQPSRVKASRLEGVFKYTSDTPFNEESKITIPARTLFTGTSEKLSWINIEPITLTVDPKDPYTLTTDADETKPPALLTQGIFREFTVLGTGESLQSFSIPTKQIDDDNMRVFVKTTGEDDLNRVEWTHAKTFFQITTDSIYFVEEDITNEGTPKIVFGNGLIGAIPSITQTISVEYLETLASTGNGEEDVEIPSNLLVSKSFDIDFFDVGNLTFTPIADSFGGKEYETLEEIKQNAPRFFAAAGRAVTKNDFETVILNEFSSIVDSFVVVGGDELKPGNRDYLGDAYIAGVPTTGAAAEDFLSNQNIYLSESQEAQILQELRKIGVIATRKFFLKPTYVYVGVEPTVEVPSSKSAAERNTIIERVRNALVHYFDDELSLFRFNFRETKVRSVMDAVPGVVSSDVDLNYGFILNKDTFYIGKNTTLYLPVRYLRDISGNIIQDELGNKLTTNFIKKNTEIAEDRQGVIEEYNDGLKSRVELFRIYSNNLNEVTVEQPTYVWYNKDEYWYPTLQDTNWGGTLDLSGQSFWTNGGQILLLKFENLFDLSINTTEIYNNKGQIPIDATDVVTWVADKIAEINTFDAVANSASTTIDITRNHNFNLSVSVQGANYIDGTYSGTTYIDYIPADGTAAFDHKWNLYLNETLAAYVYLEKDGTINVNTLDETFMRDIVEAQDEFDGIDKNPSAGRLYNSIYIDRVFTRSNLIPEEVGGIVYGNSAISGQLTHSSLTRWLYNSDLYKPKILGAFVTSSETSTTKSFAFEPQSWKGTNSVVYSSLLQLVSNAVNDGTNVTYQNVYNMYFNNTASNDKAWVGTLYWDTTAANDSTQFSITINQTQGQWLIENGFEISRVSGTDAIEYEGFIVTEINPGEFAFTIPMYAELSTFKIWGKHRLMAFEWTDGVYSVDDNYTGTFRDVDNLDVPIEFEVDEGTGNLTASWEGLTLFTVSANIGNVPLQATIHPDDYATFNELGLRSQIRLEPYRFYTETPTGEIETRDGFAVYSWDIYHGSEIGDFEYNNGEGRFLSQISGFTDANKTVVATTKIRDFFDNYEEEIKMDIITIIPDNEYDEVAGVQERVGLLTDFDGVFTQTIRGDIATINYTLI